MSSDWAFAIPEHRAIYLKLAELGICETREPNIKRQCYRGSAFIGEFEDIPKVAKPLVLNCFTTAHCPLLCKYCHADDLMKPFRDNETDEQIETVVESVKHLESVVAVITGGDPLTRVNRAVRLIEGISTSKALVMDTSGVPTRRDDVYILIPVLVKHQVHVRVSLDEFEDTNSKVRPINRRYVSDGRTSYSHAEETIKLFLAAGVPVTVQTVLSKFNDNPKNLFDFARVMHGWGVRNWVIHVTVLAGKAGQVERLRSPRPVKNDQGILPEEGGLKALRTILRLLEDSGLDMDLRMTNANAIRHAVFLVNSEGDLYTEGMAKLGKVLSFRAGELRENIDVWKDVDAKAHTARYANWVEGLYPTKSLSDLTLRLFPPILKH